MSGMVPAVVGVVRWRTTPDRVRGMTVITLLATVALGLVASVAFGGIAVGLRLIGQQSDPEVIATTDLYYALNDMDAQVANVLLVGRSAGLGIHPAQALALYEQAACRRTRICSSRPSWPRPTPAPSRRCAQVLDGLGRYEALAGSPSAGRQTVPRPAARPRRHWPSTGRRPTCCRTHILPAAHGLTDQHARALDRPTRPGAPGPGRTPDVAVVGASSLLAALVGCSSPGPAFPPDVHSGPGRGHRRCAALAVADPPRPGGQAGHLRVAKTGRVRLDRGAVPGPRRQLRRQRRREPLPARPGPGRQYQQAFADQVPAAGRGCPDAESYHYDAALAAAISAYQPTTRTSAWPASSARSSATSPFRGAGRGRGDSAAYQMYQRDDRHIRALNQAGRPRHGDRVRTSYAPGNSNGRSPGTTTPSPR